MGRNKISRDDSATQQQLMVSALEITGELGIVGTTARKIADHAGVNQALIFYHFGSVKKLLIEAITQRSNERLAVYRAALEDATNIQELIDASLEIFREDRTDCSYISLSQMVAGAQNDEELADALKPLFDSFVQLAHEQLERVLGDITLPGGLSFDEVAILVVAAFLGVQLLGLVEGYGEKIEAVTDKTSALGPLMSLLPLLTQSK